MLPVLVDRMAKHKKSWLKVKWTHAFKDEPILIYSEIRGDGSETRKIEYFAGGAVGLASKDIEIGPTRLSSEPLPEMSRINEDPQFEAEFISEEEFDALWDVYV